MKIGDRIKNIRKALRYTQKEVAENAGISRMYLSDVEKNRYNPSLSVIEKIAEAMGISVDRLTGDSVSTLIAERLGTMNMTYNELAKRTGTTIRYLEGIDDIKPDEGDYEVVGKIADVIGLNPGVLRAALARQEPPFPNYDEPSTTIERDSKNIDFEVNIGANFDETCDTEKLKKEAGVIGQADEALKSIGTTVFDMVLESLEEEDVLKLAARTIGYTGTLTKEQIEQIKIAMKIILAKNDR